MYWAQIEDNVVTWVTVGTDPEGGQEWLTANVGGVWVAAGTDEPLASVGSIYDPATGTFSDPVGKAK